MQAMLRALRPRLFAAAVATPQPQQALAVQAAWQSGLPLAAVRQQQREGAMQQLLASLNSSSPVGGSDSSRAGGAIVGAAAVQAAAYAAGLYSDSLQQAALAADGQLSTALQDCACLGADAAGRVFWTGQLNASYPIAAVRLLLPLQLGNGSSSAAAADATDGAAAGALAAAAPPPAPSPAAEAGVAAIAAMGTPALLSLDVRVGDSLDHAQNQRCGHTSGASQLQQPLLEVRCEAPVAGCYVTVALAAASAAPAMRQQQQQLCLCEVQPLSAVAPAAPLTAAVLAGSAGGAASARLPAVPLNLTGAIASQSTSNSGSSASTALASWPAGASKQQCSSTRLERTPWW